jgi:uncharacterized protein (DUF2062 family)
LPEFFVQFTYPMLKTGRSIYQSGYFKDVFMIPSDSYRTVLTFTVGFYLAIFPVPGTVTLLCILMSFLFRLNLVILQGMNLLFTPLQLILIYPFMKTGRYLFFSDTKVLPVLTTENLLQVKNTETMIHILHSIAGGILVWGIFCLTTGFFIFRLLLKMTGKKSPAGNFITKNKFVEIMLQCPPTKPV